MQKRDVVAMVLAGGQGSRLGILTKKSAKPAVPFGGKYRLIDFTLSNCANSGIDLIGVLSQYQPLTLNSHIGIGGPWDLDRRNGGVMVLPPYLKEEGGEWYKGTANAVYQNLDFISQYDPEFVLILSGDHIYKMDYRKLLGFHQQKQASVTIAVVTVPWEETSRFGVMRTEENGRIVEFQEKPQVAKGNLASMGVYVFNWPLLREYLEKDEGDPASSKDFGKDVIPAMLRSKERMYAYPFKGYWRDVGTIESLWEANMDLLQEDSELALNDPAWPILTVNHNLPPQFSGPKAEIKRSLISDGCLVLGKVKRSVIFTGVSIAQDAEVVDSVLMPGVKVEAGCKVSKAIIGAGTVLGACSQIGQETQGVDSVHELEITVIEDQIKVPAGARILANQVLKPEFPEERIS